MAKKKAKAISAQVSHLEKVRARIIKLTKLKKSDNAVVLANDELENTMLSQNSSAHVEVPQFAFFQNEGRWTISWLGKVISCKGRKGYSDIQFLLKYPGQPFSLSQVLSHEVAFHLALDRTAITDASTIRDIKAAILVLEGSIETETNPELRLEKIDERQFLEKQLKSSLGKKNRIREVGAGPNALRALSKRIREASSELRNLHPDLGEHLDSSIQIKISEIKYAPNVQINWILASEAKLRNPRGS